MGALNLDTIFTAHHQAMVEAIRGKRLAKGLRQSDVARRMGVSLITIVRIENGQRRVDIVEYWRLAQAIGFDAARLMNQVFKAHNKRR